MLDLSAQEELLKEAKAVDENSSLEDIEKHLAKMKKLSNDMNNMQLGIKIMINSVYGATAAPYFIGYNPKIAEAITLQGQRTIKFASDSMEQYFKKLWPIDKKVHKALGIKKPGVVTDAVTRYGDTDSVAKDSVVRTQYGETSIEDLYEKAGNDAISYFISNDHEILAPKNLFLENYNANGEIEMSKVRYLIRHKVNKPKYRLKTKSGKEIFVTGDHSCIVFRNRVKLEAKASEIEKTDKVLTLTKENYIIEEIESVECVGDFTEDEYVYDVEMDDDTHTFIANDILVHNSTYITFQEAFYNTEWEDPDNHVDGLHFITKLYELRLEDFLNSQFEKYAKQWNTKNLQNFELETISKTMILIAKKRYVGDMVYKDGIEIESMKHIKLTGVELVQSSTPTFARQELLNIVKKFLLEGKNMDYRQFVLELKDLKKKFMTADMNDICFGSAVNNIEKGFTITHKGDDIELEFNLGCPIHVKASGRYNYTLMGSEFKKKYSLIRSGDKIKYYYMKGDDPKNPAAFAFLPGSFPYEIAPEVDYDVMFEKAIINPVNRFLEPMGFPPIPGNLVVMRQLF